MSRQYKSWLTEAGFVDVVEHRLHCPGGPWPRDRWERRLGLHFAENVRRVLEGASVKLLREGLGISWAAIRELLAQARTDLSDERIHFNWPW
jgi:hypothetical protein